MKVAIVGAGIVGLYLAKNLSAKGHQVTVFEQRSSVGKEACSGLFSEAIFGFVPQSKKLVQNRIKSALINFPRKTVRVSFKKQFVVMSHQALDRLAADLALEAGVTVKLGQRVDSEALQGLKEAFERVIGCDGANSQVRGFLGLKPPGMRLGILGFTEESSYADYVETWPVKKGFLWKIPRGEETEYGVLAEPGEAKAFLDDFCKKSGILLQNIKSALVPLGLSIPKNNKITLCGDAAGLTKPWSGGGVIWGLRAADILLKTFPDMIKYQHGASRVFSPKMLFSSLATRSVYLLGAKAPFILPKKVIIEGDSLL